MMRYLRKFIREYGQYSWQLRLLREQHGKLLQRASFSYGISIASFAFIFFLAGNHYPVPISLCLLCGLTFVYASGMLAFASNFHKTRISKSNSNKLDSWATICEIGDSCWDDSCQQILELRQENERLGEEINVIQKMVDNEHQEITLQLNGKDDKG